MELNHIGVFVDVVYLLEVFDDGFVRCPSKMGEFFSLPARLAHPTSLVVLGKFFPMLPIPGIGSRLSLCRTRLSTFVSLAAMLYGELIVLWKLSLRRSAVATYGEVSDFAKVRREGIGFGL